MTATMSETPSESTPPRWIAASLNVKEGRDPLGLQTTTQDRLMPRLLPGILELSRRARYLSFHAFLLDTYRQQRRRADGNSLSTFIKEREWDYGLAVMMCPHACGSSPVGALSLRRLVQEQREAYPRGESVESPFGGYGLYYRSPLVDLGIVARAGTQLGDKPTPIDVLRDTRRVRHLAETFADAVASTDYVKTWMHTVDPIPADVLVEYARAACLCQLRERHEERAAVHDALFGQDDETPNAPHTKSTDAFEDVETRSAASDEPSGLDQPPEDSTEIGVTAATAQRRRSVAHFLSLLDHDARVVDDEGAYREAMWATTSFMSPEHERVAGQWAGLIAKDVWQDALCSIWSEFCRAGFRAASVDGGSLTWDRVRSLASSMTGGPPALDGTESTRDLIDRITLGELALPGVTAKVHDAPLESIRAATERTDSAASGLIAILELHRRAAGRVDPGWLAASAIRSAWQPSLAASLQELTVHLQADPTVEDTMWWIVQRYVVAVHERIAYSKLPDHTFRFRWEEGRVRFYGNGIGRFPLAAIRQIPMAQITWDLALWDRRTSEDNSVGSAELTDRGRTFVVESLT
jgi:hypothetical protein